MDKKYRYDLRGVSATKDEVHRAIEGLDKGLFPNAFCKVIPDIAAGDPQYCNLMHADTAGTKTSLAYLYWRETGDLSVWHGIAQDAIVMNVDDMACVGCTDQLILSSTIGRNKHRVPGEVVAALIEGTQRFIERMAGYGTRIHLAGGETADVGDIVRTVDVGYTAFARMRTDEVVENHIEAGDVIVGLASYGQAVYEDQYNGGMGSNGLTSARHDVLHHDYAIRYPESFDPGTPDDLVYVGSQRLTDTLEVDGHTLTVGKLLLSPTRTYLPFLRRLLDEHRSRVHGLIHNTGGGQTKALRFLGPRRAVKDKLLPLPPLFDLIRAESGADWKEMYQVFNMGHRLEVYCRPEDASVVLELARDLGIGAGIVGRVEEADQAEVRIESPHGTFTYR